MPQVPPLIAPPDQIIPEGDDYNRPDKPNISTNRGDPGHKIDIAPSIAAEIQTLDTGDTDPTLTQDELDNLIGQLPSDRSGNESEGEQAPIGHAYDVIDVVIKSNRYNMAGMVKANVLGDVYSDTGTQLTARLGLDGPDSTKLVGAGRVWKSYPRASVGQGSQDLKSEIGTTIISYDEIRWLNLSKLSHSFKNRRISSIVKKVFNHADVRGTVDISPKANKRISVSYNYVSCGKILNDLARRVNGVWFVDYQDLGNTILFTDSLNVDIWNIGGVAKTSLGLQEQPYTRVVVIGGYQLGERGKGGAKQTGGKGTNSGGGQQGSGNQGGGGQGSPPDYMFSKTGEDYTPHIVSQDPVRAVVGEPGRTFKHYDQSIHFQKQAKRIATSLLQEFARQQRYGTITITGDPRIHPYDVIQTPPSLNHAKYIVSEVEHRVNMTDGYRTTIHVSGTVKGGPITQIGTGSGSGGGSSPSTGGGVEVTRDEITTPDMPGRQP